MIGIVVALPAEARPLIARFKLSRVERPGSPRLFIGDDLALAISGVGKPAARRAVEALFGFLDQSPEIRWLNVGLAGHWTNPLGTALLAASVKDAATGEIWSTERCADLDLPTADVVTMEKPELEYPGEALYDMEAAAVCRTAARLTPAAAIQVLKVVSDNLEHPAGAVTARLAGELIADALPAIEAVLACQAGKLAG